MRKRKSLLIDLIEESAMNSANYINGNDATMQRKVKKSGILKSKAHIDVTK